jgi:hypothetical protein
LNFIKRKIIKIYYKIQISIYSLSIISVTIDAIEVGIASNGRYRLYLLNDHKFYVIGLIVGVVVGDIYHICNWLLCDN